MNKEPMRERSYSSATETRHEPRSGERRPADEVVRVHDLETRAAAARERLLKAVEALDARRRQIVRIGTEAKDLAVPVVVSVVTVGALLGASVLFFAVAIRRQRRRSFAYRFRAALPRAPERRPSFMRIIAEKGVATLAGLAATELGRLASKNLLDGRYPSGRLAVPPLPPRYRQNEIQVR
jgi:hypothetical protein